MEITHTDSATPAARRMPEIIEQHTGGNEVEYLLYIPPDLHYFHGHFPQHPILPGVVQIKWAIALAQPLRIATRFQCMDRIKFMRLITPGIKVSLHIKTSTERTDFTFRFFDERGNYSSGRLAFSQ